MSHQPSGFTRLAAVVISATTLTTSFSGFAFADPPRWAKAHGYHKKKHRHEKRHHRRPRVVYVERHDHHEGHDHREKHRHHQSSGIFDTGTILGAVIGAAAGTQVGKGKGRIVAVLGGAVIGAVLGGEIGRSMQKTDLAQAQNALETSPTGQSVTWRNPDTGTQYRMLPTRTYKSGSNQDCREFTTWAGIDGNEENVRATACRQPNGNWQQLKI